MTTYRHGDVLLIRLGDAPRGGKSGGEAIHVLAEGEVTGHAHRAFGEGATYAAPSLLDQAIDASMSLLERVLSLPAGGRIVHEEHRQIDLPAGLYEVRIQRTRTQAGNWAQVRD